MRNPLPITLALIGLLNGCGGGTSSASKDGAAADDDLAGMVADDLSGADLAGLLPNSDLAQVDGGGVLDPSAPSNLLMTGQTANSISLSWSAPTGGANPVDHYKIYRNGSAYATSTTTTYTDSAATNASSTTFATEDTIYAYAVSAVDTHATESSQTSDISYWVYYQGTFNWAGDYSYSATIDYMDTAGMPESGTYDMKATVSAQGGGIQPYAGKTVPTYDFQGGAFNYFSVDLKPTIGNQKWTLSMISRLPPGDVYPWAAVQSIADYGPAPVAGKWATYKVPLAKLSIGITKFTGSISGTTLTVTSVASGPGVDAGGYITGAGVEPGTYITGYTAKGGAGTYTISPSQTVAATSMTEQRTGCYKFDVIDESGAATNTYYVDNVKFTAN